MSWWIIVPVVIFELTHFVLTIFLLMALGGLGKQHEGFRRAMFIMAKQCDSNFENLKDTVNEMVRFINSAFGSTENKPVSMQKIDKTFKN